MSNPLRLYKAKKDCRVGGFYRKKGEEFYLSSLDQTPSYLEAILSNKSSKAESKDKPPATSKQKRKIPLISQDAQVSKKDLGLEKPTPVSDVSSLDMVTQA